MYKINYLKKYLKYKNKYIELKNNVQKGGDPTMFSIQTIKNSLENIELDSYKIFSMNLSESDKRQIESIKINNSNVYDFFGNIDNLICEESVDLTKLTEYICKIGDNSEDLANKIIQIIKNIVKTLSLGYNKKHCWLTIRSVLPNNNYIITRFHCDGKYFRNYTEPQTKFVFVMKGAGTLLIEPNEQVKQVYNEYLKQEFNNLKPPLDSIEGRKLLDKELKEINANQLQINNSQGLIFLSGHSNCLIHSEPNIIEPRIFLSLVFADDSSIIEWREKKTGK